ncbi:hypothetical protein Cgig2_020688 [Carnegiea gigantea]|uniref:Uncharacterized protein n=1 Tax=Carnegiea gigantea TaxID=171969 RepID=A0A9Q1JWP2_9CARY|nr:hypothetical protein Cgig2_020688 [Carnegiea gigantea]
MSDFRANSASLTKLFSSFPPANSSPPHRSVASFFSLSLSLYLSIPRCARRHKRSRRNGITTSHLVHFPLFCNHPSPSISPSTTLFSDLQYTRRKLSRSKPKHLQNWVEVVACIQHIQSRIEDTFELLFSNICFFLLMLIVCFDRFWEFLIMGFFLILRLPQNWDWFLLCLLESTSLQEHTGSE